MNPEIEKKLNEIANHYGFTSQANMLTEEAAEYTVALNKFRRGHADAYEHIKEEVADVLVIAYQLRHLAELLTIKAELIKMVSAIDGGEDNEQI